MKNFPRTMEIRVLDLNAFTSGTGIVGKQETKLEKIFAYNRWKRAVWMVDEAARLASIGVYQGSPANIVQSMKPAVEEGLLRLFAISTTTEWNNSFGSDPAWSSRFEEATVLESRGAELVTKLKNAMINAGFAEPDTKITEIAVALSDQFSVSGAQPRAAVNLLKKAQIIANSDGFKNNHITLADLHAAAIDKYKIDPVYFDRTKVLERLNGLRKYLDEVVVGQDFAKDEIVKMWFRDLTQVGGDSSLPMITFFGKPGVGKTYLAEKAAEYMKFKTVTIEMNRYRTLYDLGAFQHQLYLALKETPNVQFILDEVEKAAIEVQESILQMVQSKHFTVNFTDANGQKVFEEVNCPGAKFQVTTNAGQSLLSSGGGRPRTLIGYGRTQTPPAAPSQLSPQLAERLEPLVVAQLQKDGISEPLLSRMQAIIPMHLPSKAEFELALSRQVERTLSRETEKHGFKVVLKNKSSWINAAMKSFIEGVSDYRLAGKLVAKMLEPLISQAVIEQTESQSKQVTIAWTPAALNLSLPMNGSCEVLLHKR